MSVLGVVSIVSIITAVFAGLLIGIEIAEAFPKRKFERLFGFRPGCLSSKTIEQMAVEERLKDLAMRFSKACQIENEFRSKVVSDFSGKDGVRAAKKRFWQAHEFAKRMGYDVRVRHSDYL